MKHEPFKSFASIMIAITTILSAIAIGKATFAASDAGDADFAGTIAAISAQETNLSNQLAAYEHSRAFAAYRRHYDLYNLLRDEAGKADASTAETLRRQMREVGGSIAVLWHFFFLHEHVKLDNSGYNVTSELDAEWARATQSKDLDPAPHFDTADRLRHRAWFLTADTIVLGLAFWFFSMGRIIENSLKYLMAAGGIILMCIGALEIAFPVFDWIASVF